MGCSHSEFGSPCKNHPTRHPQPGICPGCLTESLLTLSDQHYCCNKAVALMDYYSSCSSTLSYSYSSASSPSLSLGHYTGHHRVVSDVLGSISDLVNRSMSGGLGKSRSVTVEPETQVRNGMGIRKKKSGFWSKLLSSTGKRTKVLFGHPKNVNGRVECYA